MFAAIGSKLCFGVTVTIFYGSGTRAHARDFHELVEPALFKLMSEYPHIRFMACGHVDVTALETAFPTRVALVDLYDPKQAAKRLAASLGELAVSGHYAKPAARRHRILIVNVFFPPQAIGGATRIVAGQVAEICKSYASEYEVAVFCGNDEDARPYEMTAYAWRGVPVYSVNTPLREGNDWICADPEVGPAFEAVLTKFNPDLVHLHGIQRLTTVMIDALRSRGIPFVVTVHDAWWISDHQFLIDSRDRLELPWERPAASTAGNPPSASAVRLSVLAARLAEAKAVLAVSESFAALYRRAGIPNVRALVNGLTELPPLESAPRPEKKLRIGHFGGMGYIKGLFLLKRALSRGYFPDLELVAVDLSKTYGEESHEMWGATPVTIIGRVPQDKIGWLYGQIDVLIAPSVWPESFGLCVREAVSYGKWVVVSDWGALPEAVLPDVNGFVIDLHDPESLPAMLAKLQAEMPRYLRPPADAPHISTMRENTAELCGIFGEILTASPAAAKPKGRAKPAARRSRNASAELNF